MSVPELSKPACTWCRLAKPGAGCTAYETRPESCRTFECVWLQSQKMASPLPAELRPDRCGAVMVTGVKNAKMVLHMEPSKGDAYKRGPLARIVNKFVAAGEAVIIVSGQKRKLLSNDPADAALLDMKAP